MTIPSISLAGLAGTLIMFVPQLSVINICWSLVLTIAGWMMIASTARAAVKEQKAGTT